MIEINDADHPILAIRSLSKPSASTASLYLLKQRRKERGKEVDLTIPDGIPDFVHTAQKTAVQDFLTVIAHVRSLFAGDFAEKEGLIARLNELESTVHEVELGIYKHGFPSDRNYEEYEELCSLESVLDDNYELNIWSDNSESDKLLSSLVDYWLDEIKVRGYDLLALLQGSLLHEDVTTSFSALEKIRYPTGK